jgi:hypothetical protein
VKILLDVPRRRPLKDGDYGRASRQRIFISCETTPRAKSVRMAVRGAVVGSLQ